MLILSGLNFATIYFPSACISFWEYWKEEGFEDVPTNSSLEISFGYPNSMGNTPLLVAGIVTFPLTDNPGYLTSWNDTVNAFQCEFDLVAYTYSNWTSTNGAIYAEALTWSHLHLTQTTPDPLYIFNANSHEFPENENRTFSVNQDDFDSMRNVLKTISERDGHGFSLYQNALYNSAKITETVQNIAMAMSFRMLQGPNATLVHGSVYEMQTFIHVHWWWLALGVSLLLLASALLWNTIALSHEAHLKAWKLSLDPLLCGVDKVGIVPLSVEQPGVSLVEDS